MLKKFIKKTKIWPVILELFVDLQYVFINYFVIYIPIWTIRKLLLQINGVKIGKKARIHMGTRIICPSGISIGERSIINEFCLLDGRGGLNIGNSVSISIYTVIITASHKKNSSSFEYFQNPVYIGDCVWTGARAIVLDGSILENGVIISAGGVFKGKTQENGIYAGNPAHFIGYRDLKEHYKLDFSPFFR